MLLSAFGPAACAVCAAFVVALSFLLAPSARSSICFNFCTTRAKVVPVSSRAEIIASVWIVLRLI
jgi:hypothetical protein